MSTGTLGVSWIGFLALPPSWYHISTKDMDRLIELKEKDDSGIAFHTGPVLRWPFGRAIYLWDGEGNYVELESDEDLPARRRSSVHAVLSPLTAYFFLSTGVYQAILGNP